MHTRAPRYDNARNISRAAARDIMRDRMNKGEKTHSHFGWKMAVRNRGGGQFPQIAAPEIMDGSEVVTRDARARIAGTPGPRDGWRSCPAGTWRAVPSAIDADFGPFGRGSR